MVSRRTILQGAAAIATVAATSLPIIAQLDRSRAVPTAAVPDELYKVLVDRRFAAARVFGRDAESRGRRVHVFDGDVTDIWYHDLHPRWQKGRAAIAGFTAQGALFCLEILARDARMRVVQRIEHHEPGQETLYSWVIA